MKHNGDRDTIPGTIEHSPCDLPHALREVAEYYGIHTGLRVISEGPPSWFFADHAHTGFVPTVAIRLTAGERIPQLVAKTQKEMALAHDLRSHGAHVVEFLDDEPQVNGEFVASLMRYLPGETASHYDYGQALAELHNAGAASYMIERAAPFNPMLRTRQTVDYLLELAEQDVFFQVGHTQLGLDLVLLFRDYLVRGETVAAKMMTIAEERDFLTLIIHDVNPRNVRTDHTGRATIIDLDPISLGPSPYDLGRLDQWTRRFQRSPEWAADFMGGYKNKARRQPDPDILGLAQVVAEIRYGTSLLTKFIEATRLNIPAGEWLFAEGIRRLVNLHNPDFPWTSSHEHQQEISRDFGAR